MLMSISAVERHGISARGYLASPHHKQSIRSLLDTLDTSHHGVYLNASNKSVTLTSLGDNMVLLHSWHRRAHA
jgi:hypothetical protein